MMRQIGAGRIRSHIDEVSREQKPPWGEAAEAAAGQVRDALV